MNACTLKLRSPKYQALFEMSGTDEDTFDFFASSFYEDNGRLPELDEIPKANSEPHLREYLGLKGTLPYVSTLKLLDLTLSQSIEEAAVKLNNQYRDLEIYATNIGESTFITIDHKPSEYDLQEYTPMQIEVDADITKSKVVINNALIKLGRLYGIGIHSITNEDLKSQEWRGRLSTIYGVKAFIYDGEIYVNTDNATVDSPIHELAHILIGTLRFTDTAKYIDLISLVELFDDYKYMAKLFKNRTRNDINEEIFVTELSKYLAGSNSKFNRFSNTNYVLYTVRRTLDTIIGGLDSVKSLSDINLFHKSILDLCTDLNSTIVNEVSHSTLDIGYVHRLVNNFKLILLESNRLVELCS